MCEKEVTAIGSFLGQSKHFKISEFIILIENAPVYSSLSLLLVFYLFARIKAIIKRHSNRNTETELTTIKNEKMIQNIKFSRHLGSTSQKYQYFIAEPMGEKDVTTIAGIGPVLGNRLVEKGYEKVKKKY
jgi:hypothetical protein